VVGGAAIMAGIQRATRAFGALFKTMITDGVSAAQVQEDSIQRLNTALAQSGQFSEESSRSMQEYASALQQTTKFGDEAILSSAALLQSLGQLDEAGLKQATTAAVDMSAALGIDLKAAITLVGKAAAGEVSSFSRYGVSIKKGADNAETLDNTLRALNTQFGGAAAAQINTFSGATQQASNSFGDMTEEIGFMITQNPAVIAAVKASTQIFGDLGKEISENREEIQAFVTKGLLLMLDAIPLAVDGLNGLMNSFTRMKQVTAATIGAIADVFGQDGISDAAAEDFAKEQKIIDERDSLYAGIKERIAGVRESVVEASSKGAESEAKLTAQLEKQSETVSNLKASLRSMDEDREALLNKAIERGAKQLEAEQEFAVDSMDLLNERIALENEQANLQFEQGLINKEQHNAELLAIETKGSSDRVAVRRVEEEKKFQLQQRTAKAVSGILGNMSATASAFGKKGFKAAKAFATAQALVDTYSGATAAYKAVVGIPFVGPTLAPIAAAAAVGAGLANVATIASQQPQGFQKGGDIPGAGRGDRIPILAEPVA